MQGAAWYRAEHHAAQQFDRLLPQALGSLPVQTFIDGYYRKPSHGMLPAGAWELRKQTYPTLTYIGDGEPYREESAAEYDHKRRERERRQMERRAQKLGYTQTALLPNVSASRPEPSSDGSF